MILYSVQEVLAVSPDDSETSVVDPFVGGGDYEW